MRLLPPKSSVSSHNIHKCSGCTIYCQVQYLKMASHRSTSSESPNCFCTEENKEATHSGRFSVSPFQRWSEEGEAGASGSSTFKTSSSLTSNASTDDYLAAFGGVGSDELGDLAKSRGKRVETWIVLELCSLGSLQARSTRPRPFILRPESLGLWSAFRRMQGTKIAVNSTLLLTSPCP